MSERSELTPCNILGNISFVSNSAKLDSNIAVFDQHDQATALKDSYIGDGGAIQAAFESTLTFETTSNAVFTQIQLLLMVELSQLVNLA